MELSKLHSLCIFNQLNKQYCISLRFKWRISKRTRVTLMKKKYDSVPTWLWASWDGRMRGNPWDHREHRASGELWDSTGFPSWSVSQSNGGAPRGLFRMSPQCNASSATEQWLEAPFWQSTERDTQGVCAYVVIPSSGWSYSMWSLLLPANVSEEKKLWVIPSG